MRSVTKSLEPLLRRRNALGLALVALVCFSVSAYFAWYGRQHYDVYASAHTACHALAVEQGRSNEHCLDEPSVDIPLEAHREAYETGEPFFNAALLFSFFALLIEIVHRRRKQQARQATV